MRRWSAVALVVAVPALVLVAPTVSSLPRAQPVPPQVERVALGDVAEAATDQRLTIPDGAASAASTTRTLDSRERDARPFRVFGVTWTGPVQGVSVQVRLREEAGWTAWQEIAAGDAQPDDGSADAVRAAGRQGTDPFTTPSADGFQVRVSAEGAAVIEKVEAVLVDPGQSAADEVVGRAAPGQAVAAPIPGMISRAAWGADENLRLSVCPEGPSYTSTIRVGFVHHTAGSNDYGPADVPGILRGIYAFHVQGRGWCDVGYNFLVDKYGRIFEGRYGGWSSPVVGAHTGGFNGQSFGVSLIGTYSAVSAPPAATTALNWLLAWKLGIYHRDPTGSDTLTSAGAANSRYAAGDVVSFRVVSGHRDASFTDCPGDTVYSALPGIRADVSRRVLDEPFVRALYQDMLGRDADGAGLAGWTSLINAGGSRQQVVSAFGATDEYFAHETSGAYRDVLGRSVDPGGAVSWRNAMREGLAPSSLRPLLLSTPEFYQRSGGTPQAFVSALFATVLGRQPDASSAAGWAAVVAAYGPGPAVDGVWRSPEAGFRRVDTVYRRYLGRPAEPGAAGWAALAITSGDEAVRNGLTMSPEYVSRAYTRF